MSGVHISPGHNNFAQTFPEVDQPMPSDKNRHRNPIKAPYVAGCRKSTLAKSAHGHFTPNTVL
jgi:hypothetical protein